ncbi:hypothetical protein B0H17DRAFT_517450 [Mycena rosella]|uniref:Uncharacterized protein n=1 Tax=Mycena rosella TaxID=1033263 RepID=A0AAD7M9V4_MYCRO|nr:hypothetical protein B0H17DRAFT_517450 [Mycena rosella]
MAALARVDLPESQKDELLDQQKEHFKFFRELPDTSKVCRICALNGAVYVAWKIPGLCRSMIHNFMHRPLSGKSPALHRTFIHFFFNSMALLALSPSFSSFCILFPDTSRSSPGESLLETLESSAGER